MNLKSWADGFGEITRALERDSKLHGIPAVMLGVLWGGTAAFFLPFAAYAVLREGLVKLLIATTDPWTRVLVAILGIIGILASIVLMMVTLSGPSGRVVYHFFVNKNSKLRKTTRKHERSLP